MVFIAVPKRKKKVKNPVRATSMSKIMINSTKDDESGENTQNTMWPVQKNITL